MRSWVNRVPEPAYFTGRKCLSCGDRIKYHKPEDRLCVQGRKSDDYCATCFVELSFGKITNGNVRVFPRRGSRFRAARQNSKMI